MNEKEAIIKLKTCNDKAAFAFLYRSYWAKVYILRDFTSPLRSMWKKSFKKFLLKFGRIGKLWMKNKILPDTYLSRCATLFSTVPVRI